MSSTATDEAAVEARLQALRQMLGKKQHFEEAVNELAAAVRERYAGASPNLRKSVRGNSTSTCLSSLHGKSSLSSTFRRWMEFGCSARLAIQNSIAGMALIYPCCIT